MARGGRSPVRIGFTALWLAVWIGAILVAFYHFAARVLAGDLASAVPLAAFLAAALFALRRVGGSFAAELAGEPKAAPRRSRRAAVHRWRDNMPGAER